MPHHFNVYMHVRMYLPPRFLPAQSAVFSVPVSSASTPPVSPHSPSSAYHVVTVDEDTQ